MTKEQAIEIDAQVNGDLPCGCSEASRLIDALANAGAFTDGADDDEHNLHAPIGIRRDGADDGRLVKSWNRVETCEACQGSGNRHRLTLCQKCDGTGVVHVEQPRPAATEAGACPDCAHPWSVVEDCATCGGTARQPAKNYYAPCVLCGERHSAKRDCAPTAARPAHGGVGARARAEAVVGELADRSGWTAEERNIERLVIVALYRAGIFRDPRPVATGSKARAEEIRAEVVRVTCDGDNSDWERGFRAGTQSFSKALDRAGFFADEATLAEIEEYVREILRHDKATKVDGQALCLASAFRKLGIGQ